MDSYEVRQRLSHFERWVDRMAMASQNEPQLPRQVKEEIRELQQHSDSAHWKVDTALHSDEVRKFVDLLGRTTDDINAACETRPGLSESLREAVKEAHLEISVLRQHLH